MWRGMNRENNRGLETGQIKLGERKVMRDEGKVRDNF